MLLAKICLSCMHLSLSFHLLFTFILITALLITSPCHTPLLHLMNPLDDQELEELHYESWYKDREMDFTQVCVKRPVQLLHGCVCLCA